MCNRKSYSCLLNFGSGGGEVGVEEGGGLGESILKGKFVTILFLFFLLIILNQVQKIVKNDIC